MTRPVPSRAITLIKTMEGCELVGYPDVGGIPTWGYGHTGPEVRIGKHISQQRADADLAADLDIAAKRLARVLKESVIAALTDNQYSALLSFVLNLGANPEWGIWTLVNAGKFDEVPSRLQLYNKARIGGKLVKVAGLTRRRQAEAALWEEGQGEEVAVAGREVETPPTQTEKPVAQSKTFWAGATVVAGGVVTGAQQIQAIAAPQAANSELVGKLVGFASLLIVAGGIAVMVFRYFDAKRRRA